MKKSFKRTIAVLLAVLMAMFSMPLSALAWTSSDTVPDINFNLRFGTFYNAAQTAGDIVNFKSYDGTSPNLENAGLAGPELDYDGKQITLDTDKLTKWYNEIGEAEMTGADYEGDTSPWGVGDYFTVTCLYENIDQVAAAGAYISYSDNITPAFVFGEGATSRAAGKAIKIGTFDDYIGSTKTTAAGAAVTERGLVSGQNAEDYYANIANISAVNYKYYSDASNPNNRQDNEMYVGVTSSTGTPWSTADGILNGSIYSDANGYNEKYEHTLVAATFAFKIIGTGDIDFHVTVDPTKSESFNQDSCMIHNMPRSQEPIQATYWKTADHDSNPGSTKIAFMGKNEFWGDTPATDYTVNFLDAENGNEIATFTGPTGTAVTVPALADYTTAADSQYHYNASWNETPVTAIGSENKTYYVVNTPVAHTFGDKNYEGDYHGTTLGHATHASKGYYTQTCSECGTVVLGEEEALAEHTYGDATVTLGADGATVTENRVCTVEGAKDTSASVQIVDAATQGKAATCTANATKYVKAVVTYADNYQAESNEVEVEIPNTATGHTYDTENIAWAWSGDYSNATATATYSCTAGDDTQSNVPATMSYVDNAETEKRTYTAKISIDGVEYSDTKEYALPHDHSWSAEKVKMDDTEVTATCKTAGGYYKAYKCTKCGEFDEDSKEWVDLGLDATNHEGPVVDVPAKAETCEEAGYTAGKYCEACETYTEGHQTIEPKQHAYGDIQFTWNDANTEATAAQVCANDPSHVINYEVDMRNEIVKRPTIKDTGLIKYIAEVYDEEGNTVIASDYREVVTAAKGANIVVAKADGGYATGTVTTEVGRAGSVNLAYGTSYKVTAVPADGYKFVGWKIGSKVVSDAKTYSDVAVKNVTLTPVFAEDTGNTITVIFYDMYGNVIKSYDEVTPEAFQAEMNSTGAPEAPAYVGYTFSRYSMSDDALKALAESAQVWAQYDKNAATTYTVTVENGTITEATTGEISGDGKTLTGANYDTKVTVNGEGVEAWKLNGTISGYGDNFVFYVGTNSTVEGVALTEEAKPEVGILSATLLDNGIDYTVLASASVPDGYKIKSRGFIYGKEATADELTLDNVGNPTENGNGAVVKELQNKMNNVDQFALTYGLNSKTGTFRVKAYIIVDGPNGVETITSDAYTVTYGG